MKPSDLARFMTKVRIEESGCWIWTAGLDTYKYGQFYVGGRYRGAHRWICEQSKGAIPKGHYVCHTCDTPSCVNPSHLWTGPSRDNLKDCVAKGRHFQANQTVCKHGHPLTPENVRLHTERLTGKTKRHCKLCEIARCRIRLGWPEHLAFTLPRQQGYRWDGTHSKHPRSSARTTGDA